MVVAILKNSGQPLTLVESDQKKCAFLRTAIRQLSINAEVQVARIEELAPMSAGVVSARALADLDTLLSYADLHLDPLGTAIFPKGKSWEKEVETAQSRWSFELEVVQSVTDIQAAILMLTDIQRKAPNDEQAP